MEQHRIALVGGGHRGIYLAGVMIGDPQRATLAAVAEPRDDRQEDCRKAFDLPPDGYFRYHDALLAHRDRLGIDGGIIATNVASHAEIACAFLDAGIPVYLEKPMTMTIEQGWRVLEVAERTKVPIQVGFNMRYSPFFTKVRDLASSGEIGVILSIEWAEVVGPRHWADGYCRNPSYGMRASVGSWLLEKSCHDMDMLNWIVGAPCRRVSSFGDRTYFLPKEDMPERCGEECRRYPSCVWKADASGSGMASWLRPEEREVCVFHARSDIVDHQNVILEFEGGTIASFNLNPLGLPERRYFTIYGTDGTIYGDTSTNKVHIAKTVSNIETIHELGAEGGHGGSDACIVQAFIDLLDDPKRLPKTGVREGFEAVLMGCAIEISREEKRVVDLEEYRANLPNRLGA